MRRIKAACKEFDITLPDGFASSPASAEGRVEASAAATYTSALINDIEAQKKSLGPIWGGDYSSKVIKLIGTIKSLAEKPGEGAVSFLQKLFSEANNINMRLIIISGVQLAKNPKMAGLLIHALGEESEEIRREAQHGLGLLSIEGVLENLHRLFLVWRHAHPYEAFQRLYAMVDLKGKDSLVQHLGRLLRERNRLGREIAKVALVAVGEAGVNAFKAACQDENPRVVAVALQGLLLSKNPASTEALKTVAPDLAISGKARSGILEELLERHTGFAPERMKELLVGYGVYTAEEIVQREDLVKLYLSKPENFPKTDRLRLIDYLILTNQDNDTSFADLLAPYKVDSILVSGTAGQQVGDVEMVRSGIYVVALPSESNPDFGKTVPIMLPEETIRGYRWKAQNFFVSVEEKVRLVIKHLGKGPLETILDFGCGSGSIALKLAREKPSIKIIGVEANPYSLKLALIRATEFYPEVKNIQFRLKDARQSKEGTGLASKSVDVVLATDDIFAGQPSPWITDSVNEWVRVLKEKGKIIFLGARGQEEIESQTAVRLVTRVAKIKIQNRPSVGFALVVYELNVPSPAADGKTVAAEQPAACSLELAAPALLAGRQKTSSPAAFSSSAHQLLSSSAVRSGAQQLSSLAAKEAASIARDFYEIYTYFYPMAPTKWGERFFRRHSWLFDMSRSPISAQICSLLERIVKAAILNGFSVQEQQIIKEFLPLSSDSEAVRLKKIEKTLAALQPENTSQQDRLIEKAVGRIYTMTTEVYAWGAEMGLDRRFGYEDESVLFSAWESWEVFLRYIAVNNLVREWVWRDLGSARRYILEGKSEEAVKLYKQILSDPRAKWPILIELSRMCKNGWEGIDAVYAGLGILGFRRFEAIIKQMADFYQRVFKSIFYPLLGKMPWEVNYEAQHFVGRELNLEIGAAGYGMAIYLASPSAAQEALGLLNKALSEVKRHIGIAEVFSSEKGFRFHTRTLGKFGELLNEDSEFAAQYLSVMRHYVKYARKASVELEGIVRRFKDETQTAGASSPAVTPINTDSKAMNTDKLACSMKLAACSIKGVSSPLLSIHSGRSPPSARLCPPNKIRLILWLTVIFFLSIFSSLNTSENPPYRNYKTGYADAGQDIVTHVKTVTPFNGAAAGINEVITKYEWDFD
ncbi:MAG: methyltransferase domain-containing protein, partial [Candidatus Omnitrophota bacterium]